MSASTPGATPHYYVPADSRHPIMAAGGLFFVILGATMWINGHGWGAYSLALGLAWWLFVLFQWMREGYLGYRKFRIRADQTGDIVVMRSAEMYLIAAEALAREGRLEEAVKPLNTLRNARGLADYDLAGKTQERLVDDILLERRRELWGEGFGITDILRTQRSVERMPLTKEEAEKTYDCWQQGDTYREYNPEGHWFTSFPDGTKFVPNSVYYLYAIPEKETNANPNL